MQPLLLLGDAAAVIASEIGALWPLLVDEVVVNAERLVRVLLPVGGLFDRRMMRVDRLESVHP